MAEHKSVCFTANLRLGGHGGCCVTVGKEGQFASLEKAINQLLVNEKRADICLCLMPGDHELRSALDIAPPASAPQPAAPAPRPQTDKSTHVRIGGCGPGSRLLLVSDGCLNARNLSSFTLSDLSIFASTISNPIIIQDCNDVTVSGCHLRHDWTKPSHLLTVGGDPITSGARRILIADNLIESRKANPRATISIRDPGRALAIADANAETAIINNLIFGEVLFYGTQSAMTEDDFNTKIAKPIRGKLVIDLKADGGDARIEGNSLTTLVVDEAILTQIATTGGQRILGGLFRRVSLLNNTINSTPNAWIGIHVISNGNHFVLQNKTRLGSAAGAFFICTGTSANFAGSALNFAVSTPGAFRESANLIALNAL
jgi:hypothetical protein